MRRARVVASAVVLAFGLVVVPPAVSGGGHLAEATTFDGGRWLAWYPTGAAPDAPILGFAQALVDGGAAAYDDMVSGSAASCGGAPNPRGGWGLAARDSDCTFHVVVFDGESVTRPVVSTRLAWVPAGNEIVVFVALPVEAALHAQGFYLNPTVHDERSVAGTIMAHELFHVLQWGVNGRSPPWSTWIEGQARVAAALAAPDVEHDATSLFYGGTPLFFGDGVNDWQHDPGNGLCAYHYALGHYWARIVARDGGVGTLVRVMEELDALPWTAECEEELPGAVTRALASARADGIATEDGTFEDSLVGHAVGAYARDLTFAGRDWGAHMRPVSGATLLPGDTVLEAQGWGTAYARLPPAGVHVVEPVAAGGWRAVLLLLGHDGTVEARPLDGPARVDASVHAEVAVGAVRVSPDAGTLTLRTTSGVPP